MLLFLEFVQALLFLRQLENFPVIIDWIAEQSEWDGDFVNIADLVR